CVRVPAVNRWSFDRLDPVLLDRSRYVRDVGAGVPERKEDAAWQRRPTGAATVAVWLRWAWRKVKVVGVRTKHRVHTSRCAVTSARRRWALVHDRCRVFPTEVHTRGQGDLERARRCAEPKPGPTLILGRHEAPCAETHLSSSLAVC